MKRRIAMILALLMCLSLVLSALPAMAGTVSDAPAAAPERKLSLRLLETVAGKADDELIFLNVFLKGLSDADLAAMLPMPEPDESASSAELSAYANAKHELKQRIYPGIVDAFARKYLTEPERVGYKYYQTLPGFQGYVRKSRLLELAALDEVVWMNSNYSVYIVPDPVPQDKIAAPLLEYMEAAPEDEGIPVRLWLRGPITQEIEGLTAAGYPTPDSTLEEIQAYRAAYRQASTDFQNDRYGLFAQKHLDKNDEILYKPQAVKIPVMVVKATKAKIAALASLRFVSRIDPAFGYDEAFPDPELPEDEGALDKLDAQLREFMKLAAHDELISVEIDLAKSADAALAVMGANADPTDLFVQSYLDETDEVISRNASASRVTATVPKYKIAALAALDEVTAIRWYLGSDSLTVMEADPVYLSPEDGTAQYNVVNFTVPDAGKYEIVGQSKSEVTEGVGLTMTANRQNVNLVNIDPPVIGEDAYQPEDLVKVPVSGDWTATLLFGFDPGASQGYYEFFYYLAMQGEDYKNLAGIFGLFDGFRDYLFRDGEYLGTPDSVAVNDSGLAGSDTHWLRIDKTGDCYVCSASADGRTFIELFSLDDTGVEADYLIIDAYSWMFTGYTYTLRSLAIEQKGQSAVPPVNYDALRQAIAAAEKLDLNDYTGASADAVYTALRYARQALNAASQQEADAAAQALNDAVAALVVRQALDFSEVNALAARVDAVYQSPEKYTEESLREFMRLEQRVSIDDLVMEEEQEAIDYVAQCLREALAALVPVQEEPDPEVLKKLDPYLLEQMEKAPDNAKIPIDVSLATPSEEEILAQIDVPAPGAGATLEEVNAYNAALRKAKRAVYSAITSAFVEDYLDENDTVRVRGNYIPTLIIEVPKPKVLSLAALEEVTHVGWADGYTILYPMDPGTPNPPEDPDYMNKLDAYLIEQMEKEPDDAFIPISIMLEGPSQEDIKAMLPISEPDIHSNVTLEEVEAYISAKRELSRELYSAITNAFVQEHLDENDTIRFCGRYIPSVTVEVPKQKVYTLAALENVTSIGWADRSTSIYPTVPLWPNLPAEYENKITQALKDYATPLPDDTRIPLRFDLREPDEALIERIVSATVPKPGEDASQEEIDAYNAAYREKWREQISVRTGAFVNYRLEKTETVYYIGEDTAVVICEVPKSRIAYLASMDEVLQIDLAGSYLDPPPCEHDYQAVVTAPTCTEGGYTTYTCSKCGDSYRGDETAALGHSTYRAVVTPPTCTEPGFTTYTCTRCGDSFTGSETQALGHSYRTVATPATCTEPGFTTYTCTRCGDTYTGSETQALGHSYRTVTTPPTCTEPGFTTHTCTRCGDSYTDAETAALGHSFGQWRTIREAACTAEGEQTRACVRCDEKETRYTDALGHDYQDGVCTRCGEADPDYVAPPPPVDPDTFDGTAALFFIPNGGNAGKTVKASSVEELNRFLAAYREPPVGLELDKYDEAFFREKKLLFTHFQETGSGPMYSIASVKETDTAIQVALTRPDEPTTPDMASWTLLLELDRDAPEKEIWVNGEKRAEPPYAAAEDQPMPPPICADGEHDYRSTVTPPTCTTAGYTYYVCTKCGHGYSGDEVPALGHDYKVEIHAPTCIKNGFTLHICSRCNDRYTDAEVEALGHDLQVKKTYEPSCTEPGYTAYSCTRCSYGYRDDETPALGHDFRDGVCTRCGAREPGYGPSGEPPEYHTANSVDEMLAWIKAERTKPAETWGDWSNFLNGALKDSVFLTVHPAAEDCSLEKIMMASNDFYMDYFFYHGSERLEVILWRHEVPLDMYIEQVNRDLAETYDNWQYTKTTAKIEGKETELYYYDGGYCTNRKTGKTELFGPTAIFECEGHLVIIRGIGSLYGAKWDDAWLDLFRYELVDLKEHSFDDVQNSTLYYYDPVYWAVEQGITKGTSEKQFSPDAGCTRAQVVTFLWRAAGEPEPAKTDNPFSDVKPDAYYYKAVLWAVEKGITTGTSPTTFRPDQTCTRAQIVTFLWRSSGQPEPTKTDNPFTDVKSGQYYYKAVLWAVEKGITKGTSAATFSPDVTCTRAQIVTFLYRAQPKEEPPVCEHEYVRGETTAPTCAEPGGATYTCSKCGAAEFREETPALGHDYVNNICTRCGAQEPD